MFYPAESTVRSSCFSFEVMRQPESAAASTTRLHRAAAPTTGWYGPTAYSASMAAKSKLHYQQKHHERIRKRKRSPARWLGDKFGACLGGLPSWKRLRFLRCGGRQSTDEAGEDENGDNGQAHENDSEKSGGALANENANPWKVCKSVTIVTAVEPRRMAR